MQIPVKCDTSVAVQTNAEFSKEGHFHYKWLKYHRTANHNQYFDRIICDRERQNKPQ
jgi:ribonuclease HI